MTTQTASSDVYYRDVYWNDHPRTLDYMFRLISGGLSSQAQWWVPHVRSRYVRETPFQQVLVLNCGNGWVERELCDLGIANHVVAFDYSKELLRQAEAQRQGRSIEYLQADCNAVWFPENSFDAVFNVAAMHHVQWIVRMQHLLASCLKPEGLYFNFDYVGPHRNQYGSTLFQTMQHVNELLPDGFRAEPFNHPDLQQMIHDDPTEAIHSELILPLFERYFFTVERKDLFGAIAYQIMHNNKELYLEGLESADSSVQLLLELDELYGVSAAVPPLFSFFVGRPRKEALQDLRVVEQARDEEIARETAAMSNGGRYECSADCPPG